MGVIATFYSVGRARHLDGGSGLVATLPAGRRWWRQVGARLRQPVRAACLRV